MEKKKASLVALAVLSSMLLCCSWSNKLGYTATGYDAKVMCSGVFISKRAPEEVKENDLIYTGNLPVNLQLDFEERTVYTELFGTFAHRAVYREGLGCTLVFDTDNEILAEQARSAHPAVQPLPNDLPWPEGNAVDLDGFPPELGRKKHLIEQALQFAFLKPDPGIRNETRAVVIVHKGKIIAEQYAEGFSSDTPLVGWSMTKSITNALVGILVGQVKIDIYAPANVPEWQSPGTPRAKITLDQLLRMSSGLDWVEDALNTDIVQMMFQERDTAAFAAGMPLAYPPDSHWCYSSGTSNIISGIIRRTFGNSYAEYLAFPYVDLFHKLGMNSAVLEPDASGTFVGSSYLYATARDWARFGLLYLQDGVWNGERILPEGWVEYSVTPTPAAPQGGYGAHFWTNAGSPTDTEDRWMPKLPRDLFSTRGLYGQFVTVIPSHDLVVVRMGLTQEYMKRWDHQSFLEPIIEAVSQ